jgi:hypothetical protein
LVGAGATRKQNRTKEEKRAAKTRYKIVLPIFLLAVTTPLLATAVSESWGRGGKDDDDDDEMPLGAATIIIELTDNDIELQAFIDGSPAWKRFEIEDVKGKRIFKMITQKQLGMQSMSELFFASTPDHFPEVMEAPSEEAIAVVQEFLRKFPAGGYEFEAEKNDGGELTGIATLSHVLPTLSEIIAPVSDTDDPPVVNPDNLVIGWEPVTTRFIDDEPGRDYRISGYPGSGGSSQRHALG